MRPSYNYKYSEAFDKQNKQTLHNVRTKTLKLVYLLYILLLLWSTDIIPIKLVYVKSINPKNHTMATYSCQSEIVGICDNTKRRRVAVYPQEPHQNLQYPKSVNTNDPRWNSYKYSVILAYFYYTIYPKVRIWIYQNKIFSQMCSFLCKTFKYVENRTEQQRKHFMISVAAILNAHRLERGWRQKRSECPRLKRGQK